ncbi:hypothetical protein [Ectobacillus funiculus]|nr:hypothetical protein [Ectobacillus funiculus]
MDAVNYGISLYHQDNGIRFVILMSGSDEEGIEHGGKGKALL